MKELMVGANSLGLVRFRAVAQEQVLHCSDRRRGAIPHML